MEFKLNKKSYILIAVCFIMIGMIIYLCEPKPTTLSKFGTNADHTMIFYANWCPACQPHIKDFKNAADQSNGKIQVHEADQSGTSDLMQKYGVNAFPTIIKSSGEKYTGERDIGSIVEFANK